ncbi:nucleoside transporter C-terminal domain-containing protein, partial [Bacillus thuringiensis]|uniref:nucleoside transporter C-terminal domain-containing protein n=1 Tax=Bacillus thuringiensis TaxID=1428 RepID=UPI00241442E5
LNPLLACLASCFHIKLSLHLIFPYLLSPFPILIPLSPRQAVQPATVIPQKLPINQFLPYPNLPPHIPHFSHKTNLILTFPISPFPNFSSIPIQLPLTPTLPPTPPKQIPQLPIKPV